MSRVPWSVPKQHELGYVTIGLVLGAVVTAMLMVSSRGLAWLILLVLGMLLPAAWVCVNAIAYFQESGVELTERKHQADAEHFWRYTANRAATNKRVGLMWTGRGRRRG